MLDEIEIATELQHRVLPDRVMGSEEGAKIQTGHRQVSWSAMMSDSTTSVGRTIDGMNWLVKEEPTHYSFDALVRDGKGVWSGVRNALAQKHLRAVKQGDRVFYYHTGDEKAVVGVAKALSDPYPDPEDASGKYVAVDLAAVSKLPRPVTLAEIKADAAFKDFPLVRIARLSVMPVSDAEWSRIERMAATA
jgi:predicted RNA-binding protein with PUA-like domain